MAGAQIHGLATILHQSRQQAGFFGVRIERFEQIPVLGENLQNLIGVQGIVFGATGLKGLSELGHGRGVKRINHDEVITEQSVNESSARLLHRDRHQPAPEALSELGHPRANHFRLLFQRSGFFCALSSHLQAEDMLAVGPIDGDKGRVIVLPVVVV